MRLLVAIVTLVLLALPVKAQQDEIKSAISGQIQSFLQDDFKTAFTYAAPNIKKIFVTPERFGQMVTNGYPMVHRPSEVTFQELVEVDGTFKQDVLLRDVQGLYYVARYTMVLIDGAWQISGVQVLKSTGVGA
ncbi:MAG: DUF4864 domain-containing protein [Rhodobacteraceae bacterium]|nr:DUF4864 domain-containing protein [Paracoccaceae bacterium]